MKIQKITKGIPRILCSAFQDQGLSKLEKQENPRKFKHSFHLAQRKLL